MDTNTIVAMANEYLVTSYAYYKCDMSLVDDYVFDVWCKTLHDNYDLLPDRYKSVIEQDQLRAGTGYAIEWRKISATIPEIFPRIKEVLERYEADNATP